MNWGEVDLTIALRAILHQGPFGSTGGYQTSTSPCRAKGNVSPFPLNPFTTNVPLDRSNASKKVCSAEPNACVHSVLGPLWRSRRRVKVSTAPFLIVPRRRGLSFNAVRNLDTVVK